MLRTEVCMLLHKGLPALLCATECHLAACMNAPCDGPATWSPPERHPCPPGPPAFQAEGVTLMKALAGVVAKDATIDRCRSVPVLGAALDWACPQATSEGELTEGYQALASLLKTFFWTHEYEADEVACGLLARLRLPPAHLTAGLRAIERSVLRRKAGVLRKLLEYQQGASVEQKRQLAAQLFRGADFDTGVARLQAAVAAGDTDACAQLDLLFEAVYARRRLLALAERVTQDSGRQRSEGPASGGPSSEGPRSEDGNGTGGSCTAVVMVGKTLLSPEMMAGPQACPEPAVEAVLADLAATHPPLASRLARIEQLSAQLPMLLLPAAPLVPVGGRYSHTSVAEQVAQQLHSRLAAEAAAKDAAKAATKAAEGAAGKKGWRWWWRIWPPVAAGAVGAAMNCSAAH